MTLIVFQIWNIMGAVEEWGRERSVVLDNRVKKFRWQADLEQMRNEVKLLLIT